MASQKEKAITQIRTLANQIGALAFKADSASTKKKIVDMIRDLLKLEDVPDDVRELLEAARKKCQTADGDKKDDDVKPAAAASARRMTKRSLDARMGLASTAPIMEFHPVTGRNVPIDVSKRHGKILAWLSEADAATYESFMTERDPEKRDAIFARGTAAYWKTHTRMG